MLADKAGKLLFEVRPDLFPPALSEDEIELWGLYFERQNKKQ